MPFSNSGPYNMATAMVTVSIIGGVYYVYNRYLDKKKLKSPKDWVHIGNLKSLYAYPIKSCAPVALNQAECSALGLIDGWLRDRIMMVIDSEDNTVVTARCYPEMLKIKSSFDKKIVTLEHPSMQPIGINLVEVMNRRNFMQATIWEATVPVYDCGEEVNTWISKCLCNEESTLRLVYYASENSRMMAGEVTRWPNIYDTLRHADTSALADEVTYHVINDASVEDLNTRVSSIQVTHARFRPNLLISGCKPFDEDNWKYMKIGENVFEVIKPCIRCIFTTIDPETLTRDKNMEPLATLRSYRLAKEPENLKAAGDSPLMGILVALRSGPGGIMTVNEPVYVTY